MLLTLRPLSAFPIHDDWNVLNGLNDLNGLRLFQVLGKTKAKVEEPVAGGFPDPER